MQQRPVWQWNEIQQVGTDYSDAAEVGRYEKRMGEFRDLAAEDTAILTGLALPGGSRILEIGTGSGHFARAAARVGHRVTALDVSPAMLEYAGNRARTEGLAGIEFVHGGFLTFGGPSAAYDAVVSVVVLHHLPDLWKAVALRNVRRLLKPGGQFLLGDMVFSSRRDSLDSQFKRFVHAVPESIRAGAIGHVGKEYSTLDWIMEGLLTRSGFQISRLVDVQAPLLQYWCRAV
jgi:ubiquinone/menaquinone biosynthesis C-methylase UbiE